MKGINSFEGTIKQLKKKIRLQTTQTPIVQKSSKFFNHILQISQSYTAATSTPPIDKSENKIFLSMKSEERPRTPTIH
jgi:hypothetical protein